MSAAIIVIDQPLIDIIGHDPDAVPAAMGENGLLLFAGDHPAGRIVWRIDEYRFGSGRQGVKQLLYIELPSRNRRVRTGIAAEAQRHGYDFSAKYLRNLYQIR